MLNIQFVTRKKKEMLRLFIYAATLYNKIIRSTLHCYYQENLQVLFLHHLKFTYGLDFRSKNRLKLFTGS